MFVRFELFSESGATAAASEPDTAIDDSNVEVADMAAKSPDRLCSKDGKTCFYRRLEYDLVFLSLISSCLLCSFSSLVPYVLSISVPVSYSQALLRPCSIYLFLFSAYVCQFSFCSLPNHFAAVICVNAYFCLFSFYFNPVYYMVLLVLMMLEIC